MGVKSKLSKFATDTSFDPMTQLEDVKSNK